MYQGRVITVRAPQGSAAFYDRSEQWMKIEEAIYHIFTRDGTSCRYYYESLYRATYELVIGKLGDVLYDNVEKVVADHLETVKRKIEENSADEALLLRRVGEAYDHFRTSARYYRDMLIYLDRNYVNYLYQRKKPVFDLSIDLFRRIVLGVLDQQPQQNLQRRGPAPASQQKPALSTHVMRLFLAQVEAERNGYKVDNAILKDISYMMNECGCYDAVLETSTLAATRYYFSTLAQKFITEGLSLPDYLEKVYKWLRDEYLRARYFLYNRTEKKLELAVRTEMLLNDKLLDTYIATGFFELLQEDDLESLLRLYTLFSFDKSHLERIVVKFSYHVKDAVTRYLTTTNSNNHVSFVYGLIDLRSKYNIIVKKGFKKDDIFLKALEETLKSCCDGTGSVQGNERLPELLSLYFHHLVTKYRTSNGAASSAYDEQTAATAMDVEFENVVALFKYLSDKDVFETYHKNHLGKRLLRGLTPLYIESEKSFVAKLKRETNFVFTSKLDYMFKDIEVSEESMEDLRHEDEYTEFKDYNKLDIAVSVLTCSCWPSLGGTSIVESNANSYSNRYPNGEMPVEYLQAEIKLPLEIQAACKMYVAYYDKKHSGRRLKWQLAAGEATVQCLFRKGRYEVQMMTFYMIALMYCFNDVISGEEYMQWVSFADILKNTGIPDKDLRRHIAPLCGGNTAILYYRAEGSDEPATEAPQSAAIKANDMFAVNADFSHNKLKFKVGLVAAAKETAEEAKETYAGVEQERVGLIEAAIVRVMKSRKYLKHSLLIAEVTQQLQQRFKPAPNDIKKHIENLIDREYLERSAEDRTVYKYTS